MTKITHLDDGGAARMVDIGGKAATFREATASGRITMAPHAIAAIRDGSGKKGDVLAVARVAGIMAAKQTSGLIPLCHPIVLTSVTIGLDLHADHVLATAAARTSGATGVEMEALCAVSVTLLTIYDMVKGIDRAMTIDAIALVSKSGGRSGDWHA